jgi:hypothetical protein
MLDTTQTSHRWSVHLGSSSRYSDLSRRLAMGRPERAVCRAAIESMEMDERRSKAAVEKGQESGNDRRSTR